VNSYFSSAEQSHFASLDAAARLPWFYRCWTRKEACAKLSGEGLCLRTLACSEVPRGLAVTSIPMARHTASIAHQTTVPVIAYRARLDPAAGLQFTGNREPGSRPKRKRLPPLKPAPAKCPVPPGSALHSWLHRGTCRPC
jgi:hypothetical protein